MTATTPTSTNAADEARDSEHRTAPVAPAPDGLARIAGSGPAVALRRNGPLLAVLAVQAVLTLRLSNTAFQDEALYLYAGHREIALLLHGIPTYDNYASYFSGAPWLYPVLGATADRAGGLALARLLSLAFMLVATALLSGVTRRLFDRHAGLLAAAVFAVAAPTLFMGRLATYDALAVFLLALATWIVVAAAPRSPVLAWLAAPVLVAAIASKYAVLLYVPTVLGLCALAAVPYRGWWRALPRAGALAVLAVAVGRSVLALAGPQFVRGVTATTTARAAGTDSVSTVLTQSAQYLAGAMLLAVLGTAALVHSASGAAARVRAALLGTLLAGTIVLAPVYQAHLHTITSLQKHAGYGLLFAAPIAGYALARIVGPGARDPRRLGTTLAACLLLAAAGLRQSERRFHDWPNAAPLVAVLRTQVRPVTGHYLVEESEVPRYYLRALVQPYQWTGTYFFQYIDRDGHPLVGAPAYRAAIADRYFDVVALRYGPTAAFDTQFDAGLRDGRKYQQIARVPAASTFGPGTYTVWRAVR